MKNHILFFFLIIHIFSYSQNENTNKKWLKVDKQGFIELNEFIENDKFIFSNFKDKINKYQINNVSDIFYGAFMVDVLQPNGYTSFPITIGVFNNKIFYFKVFLDKFNVSIIKQISASDEEIKGFLTRNWKNIKYNKKGIQYSGLEFEFYDEINANRLYRLIDRFLGTKKKNIIKNKNILEAYHKLLYPINIYPFGNKCGINKVIPEGKNAINTLVKHKQFDLIKNVLSGYNAEGRAYAMEAILDNKKNDDEIMIVINKLRKSYLTLNDCYVCFFNKISYENLYLKLTTSATTTHQATMLMKEKK